MDRIAKIAERIAGIVFDASTADEWVGKISEGLGKVAPFVNVSKSTLGGSENVSILFVVSVDDKKDWKNRILENSTYFRMHLDNDGSLWNFSGYTKPAKFRKTRVKSAEEVVAKVSKFVEEIRREKASERVAARETFKPGDKVVLRHDVLKRHSQSVPPHAGFTTEQFLWRDRLDKLEGKVGEIERVFPSGHVNVQYRDGMIGIDSRELVLAKVASSDWMTAAEVGEICKACEEKMAVAGISRVRRSYFEAALREASRTAKVVDPILNDPREDVRLQVEMKDVAHDLQEMADEDDEGKRSNRFAEDKARYLAHKYAKFYVGMEAELRERIESDIWEGYHSGN